MASSTDLEKNAALPNLGDVYGGIEDNRPIGGVAEESEPIAASASSSDPKAPGGGSDSWFTKKRIIIIAVVAIVVVAGAVGGAVGGVLSSKNNTSSASSDTSSDGNGGGNGSGGGSTPGGPGSSSRTNGASPTSPGGGSTNTPANPTATGIILPSGVTAVAFRGVPTPAVSSQPISVNLGFPGLEPNVRLSGSNLVSNGDFNQNLTNWDNPDGCWDVNRWDDKGYVSAWNGEHPGARRCDLSQTITQPNSIANDTDYVVSFLYRNSVNESSDNAWFWAYLGDDSAVNEVLATNERSPTTDNRWSNAAYKYTLRANQKGRIVFNGFNDAGYWEVSMVQMVPLSTLNTLRTFG
ncbi:hypothetical protein TWF696_005646 [Orbilia brochopaga]|uniref:Uncharacterized protein n=1 Tax=Orbilia brochopaga TaxID=3140254 RepID=A0AAV9V250_9PEZI